VLTRIPCECEAIDIGSASPWISNRFQTPFLHEQGWHEPSEGKSHSTPATLDHCSRMVNHDCTCS